MKRTIIMAIILLTLISTSAQEADPFRFHLPNPIAQPAAPAPTPAASRAGQGDRNDITTPLGAVTQYKFGWSVGFVRATIPGNYRGDLPTDIYFIMGYADAVQHAEQFHK